MALTICCAIAWWVTRPTTNWVTIPARVIGATLVENTDPISASRPSILVHYSYVVEGQFFSGSTPLDPLARFRYRALPREVKALLSRKGYHNFNDLPPQVRELLRRRGIQRLDAVPEPVLDTSRAQGFNSVQDFPEDVRHMVKSGDYERAARAMEELMADRMTEHVRADSSRDIPSVVALTQGGVVQVRYDPENPASHYVVRLPVLEGAAGAALLIGSSLLFLGYCGLIYPSAKGR